MAAAGRFSQAGRVTAGRVSQRLNEPALATHSARESRGATVVMMKPVQDRQRDDLPGEFRAPVHRLLLVDALMRAGGV